MSNFLLYFVQCKGVFYTFRDKQTLGLCRCFFKSCQVVWYNSYKKFFPNVCVPRHKCNQNTHPTHRQYLDFTTVILLLDYKPPHNLSVNSVVRAIPARPAEIFWSTFLDLTTGSKKLWTHGGQTLIQTFKAETRQWCWSLWWRSMIFPSSGQARLTPPHRSLSSSSSQAKSENPGKKTFIFSMLLGGILDIQS